MKDQNLNKDTFNSETDEENKTADNESQSKQFGSQRPPEEVEADGGGCCGGGK